MPDPITPDFLQLDPAPAPADNTPDFLRPDPDPLGSALSHEAKLGNTWEKSRDRLKAAFPSLDVDGVRPQFRMAAAKAKYAGADEDALRYVLRRSVPGFSAGFNLGQSIRHRGALDRVQAGTATDADYDLIAQNERLQEIEQGRSFGGKLASGVARLPAVVGEVMMGGGLATRAGQGAARAVAPRAAEQTVVKPALREVAAAAAARTAAQTATAPSMYLERAGQRSVEQGGAFYEPKNLVPAFAYGMAQTAVLGTIGRQVAGVRGGLIGRSAAGAGAGVAEQQGVDVAAGLADRALPDAYQIKTKYGTIGKFVHGDDDAASHAAVEMLTFAVAAALHGRPGAAKEIPTAFAKAVDSYAAKGTARPVALDALMRHGMGVRAAIEADATPAELAALVEKAPPGPVRDYIRTLVGSVPPPTQGQPAPGSRRVLDVETGISVYRQPVQPPAKPAGLRDNPTLEDIFGPHAPPEPPRPKPAEPRDFRHNPVLDDIFGDPAPPRPPTGLPPEPARPPEAPKRPQEPPEPQKAPEGQPGDESPPDANLERRVAEGQSPTGIERRGRAMRDAAAEKAVEAVKKGERAVYVDMDVDNMRGLAEAKGDEAAHQHVRDMVAIVHEEIAKAGGRVETFRHAGDPKGDEHSAVVIGLDRRAVNAALDRADARIAELTAGKGYADVPHPKEGRKGGAGLTTFAEEFRADRTARWVFDEAEKGTESRKPMEGGRLRPREITPPPPTEKAPDQPVPRGANLPPEPAPPAPERLSTQRRREAFIAGRKIEAEAGNTRAVQRLASLARMTPPERHVFYEHVAEGRTIREIAEDTQLAGRKKTTVGDILTRAMKKAGVDREWVNAVHERQAAGRQERLAGKVAAGEVAGEGGTHLKKGKEFAEQDAIDDAATAFLREQAKKAGKPLDQFLVDAGVKPGETVAEAAARHDKEIADEQTKLRRAGASSQTISQAGAVGKAEALAEAGTGGRSEAAPPGRAPADAPGRPGEPADQPGPDAGGGPAERVTAANLPAPPVRETAPGGEPLDPGMTAEPHYAGIPINPRVAAAVSRYLFGRPRKGDPLGFTPDRDPNPDNPVAMPDYPEAKRAAYNQLGARNQDGVSVATTAHAFLKHVGDQAAKLWKTQQSAKGDVFGVDEKTGQFAGANGQKLFMEDAIKAELLNPGSQPLTAPQKAAVAVWRGVWEKQLKAMEAAGVKSFRDAQGNEKDVAQLLAEGYFPRPAVEESPLTGFLEWLTGGRGGGPGLPGTKPFFRRGRVYDTEAAGTAAGVKYKPDFYERVADFIRYSNREIADHKLANDAALGGKDLVTPRFKGLLAENKAVLDALPKPEREQLVKQLKALASQAATGNVFVAPAFRGKEYSPEVKRHLEQMYGEGATGRYVRIGQAVSRELRTLVLSADVSFATLQMQSLMFSRPDKWAKAMAAGFEGMFNSGALSRLMAAKPEYAQAAREVVRAGGSVGTPPEAMGGSLAERVPVVGGLFRASQNAMTTALTVAKLELWLANRPKNPAEWPRAVEAIENVLGQGRMEQIGMTPERALLERLAFLAPSYYRAHVKLLEQATQGGTPGKVARKQLGFLASGVLLTTVAALHAAKAAGWITQDELEERLNPERGKFLMVPVKLGDSGKQAEVGFGGMYVSVLRSAAMLRKWELNEATGGSPLTRWYRGHAGPIPRVAWDVATERDYMGKPITPGKAALQSVTPLGLQQAFEEGTPAQRAANVAAGMAGFRGFPASESGARLDRLRAFAERETGKKYGDLSLREQAAVAARFDRTEPKPAQSPADMAAARARAAEGDELRRQRLEAAVSKGTRDAAKQLGFTLPGYKASVHIGAGDVPLSGDRLRRYERLIAEEYNRAAERWPVERLAAAAPGVRDKFLQDSLTAARERARLRLIRGE